MMKRIEFWSAIVVAALLSGCGGYKPGPDPSLEQKLREIDDQVARERRYEELAKQAEREQRELDAKVRNGYQPLKLLQQSDKEKLEQLLKQSDKEK
jgi:hypothetical protein